MKVPMSRLYLDHHLHKQPTPHGAFPYSTMLDTCKQSANLPDGRFVYLRSKYRGPVWGMRGKNVAGRCSKSINIKAGRKQIPMKSPPPPPPPPPPLSLSPLMGTHGQKMHLTKTTWAGICLQGFCLPRSMIYLVPFLAHPRTAQNLVNDGRTAGQSRRSAAGPRGTAILTGGFGNLVEISTWGWVTRGQCQGPGFSGFVLHLMRHMVMAVDAAGAMVTMTGWCLRYLKRYGGNTLPLPKPKSECDFKSTNLVQKAHLAI